MLPVSDAEFVAGARPAKKARRIDDHRDTGQGLAGEGVDLLRQLTEQRRRRAQSGILLAGFGVVPSPNMYAGTGIRIVPLTASP